MYSLFFYYCPWHAFLKLWPAGRYWPSASSYGPLKFLRYVEKYVYVIKSPSIHDKKYGIFVSINGIKSIAWVLWRILWFLVWLGLINVTQNQVESNEWGTGESWMTSLDAVVSPLPAPRSAIFCRILHWGQLIGLLSVNI